MLYDLNIENFIVIKQVPVMLYFRTGEVAEFEGNLNSFLCKYKDELEELYKEERFKPIPILVDTKTLLQYSEDDLKQVLFDMCVQKWNT